MFFGDDIPAFIDEIYKTGLKLWQTSVELHESGLPVGEDRNKVAPENNKCLTWLIEQLPVSKVKFKKYLDISD